MTSPGPTRLSLLSPEIAVAAHPARLRALFASRLAPQLGRLVTSGQTGKARLATARALWGRPVPVPVADALQELARLATPSGRDAIVEAARDARMDHAGWEETSPVDLAARLLADPVERTVVLVRAHLRLGRLPVERATYELRAAAPRRVPEGRTGALVAALRGVVRDWSEAWVHEEDESGDLRAVALYGAAGDGAPDVGRKGPGVPGVRPTLRADAFHFRVAEARLAITAARAQRVEAYASAWGRALYDDDRFFLRAPSLTLKPLHELGAADLASANLPPEILRARVIACQLDTGRAHRVEATGLDALARLSGRTCARAATSRGATLRLDIADELRPIDAVVQPPHRIDIGWTGVAGGGARGARIARDALASLGLLSPGVVADDIATLLPLVHPEWRWRELVGNEGLAAMRAAGLLEEVLL